MLASEMERANDITESFPISQLVLQGDTVVELSTMSPGELAQSPQFAHRQRNLTLH
jgi:hypothetical protein